MKIAITDANIFIDLIFTGLHHHLFELELEVHTTWDVHDELNSVQQEALAAYVAFGTLRCHWKPDDIDPALQAKKGLSESDKSVLQLASQLDAFILTGDGLIRKLSKLRKIEVHGIFWLFDKFVESKKITLADACELLKKLMDYNKRLPFEDCKKRLELWG